MVRHPPGTLARILLLDQFTRNVHRGTALAFAGDERALATAQQAVAAGFDRGYDFYERWFCYLPFEHSEDLGDAGALARADRRKLSQDMGDPGSVRVGREARGRRATLRPLSAPQCHSRPPVHAVEELAFLAQARILG